MAKDDNIVNLEEVRKSKLFEDVMAEAKKPRPGQRRLDLHDKKLSFDGVLFGEPGDKRSQLSIMITELGSEQQVIVRIKMTKAQWRELIKKAQPFLDLV